MAGVNSHFQIPTLLSLKPVRCFEFVPESIFYLIQLLGGSRMSVDDLKEIAARQQQEIAIKERELKTKQVQLMEIKRKTQRKPQSPHVQQLSAKVDEQSERLTALRHAQDQVDSYKLSNSALGMLPFTLALMH